VRAASKGTAFDVKYLNTRSNQDFYGFTRKNLDEEQSPAVMDHILEHSMSGDIVILTFASFRLNEGNVSAERIAQGKLILQDYVDALVKKNVKVAFVKDTPAYPNVPVSQCVVRAVMFKNLDSCRTLKSDVEAMRFNQVSFFEDVARNFPEVEMIDPLKHFCDDIYCYKVSMPDHKLLYFDHHHLNVSGSYVLKDEFSRIISMVKPE
jgi:hypothetical protein